MNQTVKCFQLWYSDFNNVARPLCWPIIQLAPSLQHPTNWPFKMSAVKPIVWINLVNVSCRAAAVATVMGNNCQSRKICTDFTIKSCSQIRNQWLNIWHRSALIYQYREFCTTNNNVLHSLRTHFTRNVCNYIGTCMIRVQNIAPQFTPFNVCSSIKRGCSVYGMCDLVHSYAVLKTFVVASLLSLCLSMNLDWAALSDCPISSVEHVHRMSVHVLCARESRCCPYIIHLLSPELAQTLAITKQPSRRVFKRHALLEDKPQHRKIDTGDGYRWCRWV